MREPREMEVVHKIRGVVQSLVGAMDPLVFGCVGSPLLLTGYPFLWEPRSRGRERKE